VREAVGVADDEGLERQARVQPVVLGLFLALCGCFTWNVAGSDDVDDRLGPEHRRGTGLQHATEAVGDAAAQLRRRLEYERVAVDRDGAQWRQPEVVRVRRDRPLELALDRWPDMRGVLVHGRRGRLLWEWSATMEKGAPSGATGPCTRRWPTIAHARRRRRAARAAVGGEPANAAKLQIWPIGGPCSRLCDACSQPCAQA